MTKESKLSLHLQAADARRIGSGMANEMARNRGDGDFGKPRASVAAW